MACICTSSIATTRSGCQDSGTDALMSAVGTPGWSLIYQPGADQSGLTCDFVLQTFCHQCISSITRHFVHRCSKWVQGVNLFPVMPLSGHMAARLQLGTDNAAQYPDASMLS